FDQTGFIDIRGLHVGSGKAHRFPIQDLYIPLTSAAAGEAEGAAAGGAGAATGPHTGPRGGQAFLQHRRPAGVGDPGCGKTTFLRNIAHALAATLLNKDPAAAGERLGITEAPPFPVLIRLAELSEFVGRQKRGSEAAPVTDDSPEWLVRF